MAILIMMMTTVFLSSSYTTCTNYVIGQPFNQQQHIFVSYVVYIIKSFDSPTPPNLTLIKYLYDRMAFSKMEK